LEISIPSLTAQRASCHNPFQCSLFRQVCQPAQWKICCRMLHNLRKEKQFCISGLQPPGSITDFLHALFTHLVPQFPCGETVTRDRWRPDIKAKAKPTLSFPWARCDGGGLWHWPVGTVKNCSVTSSFWLCTSCKDNMCYGFGSSSVFGLHWVSRNCRCHEGSKNIKYLLFLPYDSKASWKCSFLHCLFRT